ncbi:MAG: 2-C-methyl-D-erythritol 4-phosphate cytidylyltransferase [Thermodesulfovibrionales bacterium]|nr:2-C-methyl-D-erythritol 4-phosphate cytidylyltransferase [Thermodesulfovibrionales bacterium]
MKKVIAIVPAAGLGKRFGQDNNKTFQALLDKPIVIWALEALECVDDIEEIIPVFKKDDMEQGLALIERFRISKVKRVAPGGKERQDSVFNGLNLIGKKADVVLIHDGVRPLIETDLIKKTIQELLIPSSPPLAKGGGGGFDGVIVGVPPKDTIKKVSSVKCQVSSEIFVQKTLDRKLLRAIQTPQVFKYSALMQAYKKAMTEKFYSTDDSAIVERYGGKVKVIMGSYTNIKVTTPEDLAIAEMLLKKRGK